MCKYGEFIDQSKRFCHLQLRILLYSSDPSSKLLLAEKKNGNAWKQMIYSNQKLEIKYIFTFSIFFLKSFYFNYVFI